MTDLVTNRFNVVYELPEDKSHETGFLPTHFNHDPLDSVFQHGELDLQVGCLPTPPFQTKG